MKPNDDNRKMTPGKYRAFGYIAPGHFWPDLKLKWREHEMDQARAPEGSSPARQQAWGLNQDTHVSFKESEGEKLR